MNASRGLSAASGFLKGSGEGGRGQVALLQAGWVLSYLFFAKGLMGSFSQLTEHFWF